MSEHNIDDSQLGRVKDLIADVRTRLNVAERLANDARSTSTARFRSRRRSRENIVDQVTEYFNAETAPAQVADAQASAADSSSAERAISGDAACRGEAPCERRVRSTHPTERESDGVDGRAPWQSHWWSYLAMPRRRRAVAQSPRVAARLASEAGNPMMFDSARPVSTDSADLRTMDRKCREESSRAKRRLLLWVDAVGGFFVCQGNEIRLGQAVPDSDGRMCRCWPTCRGITPRSAATKRDIRSNRCATCGSITSEIDDGELDQRRQPDRAGAGVAAAFQPAASAVSATARLDFVSHHRTQPSAAAVLLMADTCVLGPGAQQPRGLPRTGRTTSCCTGSTAACSAAAPRRSRSTASAIPQQGPLTLAFPRDRRAIFVQFGGNLILVPAGGVS